MDSFLTFGQKAEIISLHRQCKERRFADSLKAILLLDKGLSCGQIGEILLQDDDTIRNYKKKYLSEGANPLLSDNKKGGISKLTDQQVAELDRHIADNVYTDSNLIICWILTNFNVKYSVSGVNQSLKRLGYVYKKPVLAPCKSDVSKQMEFVEKYQNLKANLSENGRMYFMDGVHPQHNAIAGYGWIKKGGTKCLKTNNGRQKVNINEALNLQSQEVLIVEDETINSQTVIKTLEQMPSSQTEGLIHIIADNAKYYHSQIVDDFVKEHPRIQFVFLPASSPNLNSIERLWHILKNVWCAIKSMKKSRNLRRRFLISLRKNSGNLQNGRIS